MGVTKRFVACGLLAASSLAGLPAHGGAAAGTCVATFRFDFDATISPTSGPTFYTMSGSGSCQTSAQVAAAKTMNIGGQGTATSSRCAALALQGSYVVTFFPDPAPTGGNGQFNYFGTASAGVAAMNGSSPTLVAAIVAAGGGLVGCIGGTNQLVFTTSFTFVDP
jgi:hypothetical protein